MSFPKYPEYEGSGVEWLGEVPAHWSIVPVRGLARAGLDTFTDGDWIESPYIADEGVRLIQTGNIGVGEYREKGFRYISEQTFHLLRCTEVSPGDILICRLADPVGRACSAPNLGARMITSVDVCILKIRRGVDPRYVVYFFSSSPYLAFMKSVSRGGTRERVSRSFLGSVRFPLPSKKEQDAIAAFLDHQTGKIDALIEEQRRLIDLLKEKRQAVISHAVTKGLDPNVPMKDSGVEWLGEVPAHWDLIRTFHAGIDIRTGKVDVNIQSDDGEFPFFTCSREVKGSDQYSFDCEALLVAGNGEVGYTQYYKGRFEAYQRTYVLSGFSGYDPMFLKYYFSSNLMKAVESKSVGSVIQFISLGDLRDFPLPTPNVGEQKKIREFLDKEISRIDGLVEEASKGVSLLIERRSALISAAVTGKIDVRGWRAGVESDEPELAMVAEEPAGYSAQGGAA